MVNIDSLSVNICINVYVRYLRFHDQVMLVCQQCDFLSFKTL